MLTYLTSNLCQTYFTIITFSMVFFGALINLSERHLPLFISQTFRYGKFACKQNTALSKVMEVPKSYFKHFYISSALFYYPIALREVINVYVLHQRPSTILLKMLDLFCGSNRNATVSSTKVLLAFILITLQVYRRFYDTQFVSVFSKKAAMNVSHYLIGLTYYAAVILSILSQAPGFSNGMKPVQISLKEIGFVETAAIILFIWSWYHQHKTTVILANLRKNKLGNIVSEDYKIPEGDWFDYLSSPHSTAEILMYTALTLILYQNVTWWFVYMWVVSCQVETILLSHWWYQSNFKNFPAAKKALVPFIY